MLDSVALWELPFIAVLGLLAGTLGGMLGVGGSVIMIPGLTMLLGYDQHLYQASAMIVNVVVSVPAALRHRKAGALSGQVMKWMLPAAVVTVLVGVWVSNREAFHGVEGGKWLGRILAAFLLYMIVVNLQRFGASAASKEGENTVPHLAARSAGVGSVMGTIAGLLGIGGGAVAVPLQQVLLKLPLRSCIANSSAIICVSAAVGAIYKNATLEQVSTAQHVVTWQQSVVMAALLSPTAFIGGRLGASLTHRLPVRQVRIAFVVLMITAAWKMAALPFSIF
jgi:hypothetical protein